ncbi:MAG: hypothetical protein ABIQ40_11105 [Bacteroidia bacterium]
MKIIAILLSALTATSAFAFTGIHEALKNPSAAAVIYLSGEKEEAALLMKNAGTFSALEEIVFFQLTDSITAEQDIAAIAACPQVNRVSFKSCGLRNFSGALKMLVEVDEISISDCDKLDLNQAFSILAGMPSLKTLELETGHLAKIPSSFRRLRSLEMISIRNIDLSLADGYALNTHPKESLYAKENISLGFGDAELIVEYSCYDKNTAVNHLEKMRDLLQGVTGADGELNLSQKATGFNRNHPLVKAPVPGLEVHKNIYSADAVKGAAIEYPSGTKIIIPENAFVDKNGNQLKGAVTIDYREYRDQVDIMVSGIPMDYDSGSVNGHFISAGMFEMNASVDGNEVFLAPGKKVEMKFAVVDTASDFNFYKLDEQKGWVYENSPGKVENDNAAAGKLAVAAKDLGFSIAVKEFYNWSQRRKEWNNEKTDNIDPYDTLAFDERYNDTSFVYTGKKKYHDGKYTSSIFENAFSLHKTYRLGDTMCFTLVRNNSYGNNPEVTSFSGIHWKTTDIGKDKELKQLFRKKSGIHDMRIYENGGDGFILEFKTKKGKKQIHAVPTNLRNGKPVVYSQKVQATMYKRYTRGLEKRKKKLSMEIVKTKKELNESLISSAANKELEMDSAGYWKQLAPKMNEKEKAMDYDAWLNYYNATLPAIVKAEQSNDFAYIQVTEGSQGAGKMQAEALYQELKLSGFGIYNCDHVSNLPAPVAMNATFEVPGMSAPTASNVYVIDRDINTSTNFFNRGGSNVNITYNKGSKTSLIIIDEAGRLFYTTAGAFGSGVNSGNGNTRYPATMITDQPASPQQIRDLISGKN